jgi:hypothetical protein
MYMNEAEGEMQGKTTQHPYYRMQVVVSSENANARNELSEAKLAKSML